MARRRRTNGPGGGRPTPRSGGRLLSVIIWLATVILVLALMTFVSRSLARPAGDSHPAAAASKEQPIDGIQCNAGEQTAYHIHTHLTIYDRGHTITIPANTGIPYGDCLYWLHTHDTSGIIHIEAPAAFRPRLGEFFDIWGQPLSRRAAGPARVRAGQRMRVYVNSGRYGGDPRLIGLADHRSITIEIGPPFLPPVLYDFVANGY